jgi:hypothetical protein
MTTAYCSTPMRTVSELRHPRFDENAKLFESMKRTALVVYWLCTPFFAPRLMATEKFHPASKAGTCRLWRWSVNNYSSICHFANRAILFFKSLTNPARSSPRFVPSRSVCSGSMLADPL